MSRAPSLEWASSLSSDCGEQHADFGWRECGRDPGHRRLDPHAAPCEHCRGLCSMHPGTGFLLQGNGDLERPPAPVTDLSPRAEGWGGARGVGGEAKGGRWEGGAGRFPQGLVLNSNFVGLQMIF